MAVRRIVRFINGHPLEATVALLSAALLIALALPHMMVTIPSGSVGVLWLRFYGGTVRGFHFNEGMKLIPPWDTVFVYNARLRRHDLTVTALSRDMLPVDVMTTLTYSVDPETVAELHQSVGEDYESRLIEPVVNSALTQSIAESRADAVYTLGRTEVESAVTKNIRSALTTLLLHRRMSRSLVQINTFTIRRITLPPHVQQSIDEKLAEEQSVERYNFILAGARLESERKAVEAEGVRRFQEIVSSNISESYLRWRGIDATLRLAESPNSKVVVIGNGPGSMPLILGNLGEGGLTAGAPATPPAARRSPAYSTAPSSAVAPPRAPGVTPSRATPQQ
jgi:regulator of protease activity HflC (stomatin/prohibitin superfamily)